MLQLLRKGLMLRSGIRRSALRLEVIWSLVILAGFGFFVSLVPLPPNDIWWHLRIGEIIHRTAHIPTTNMFAWTVPKDAPFFYGAWLGEYLLYTLYRWGGLALTQVARTVLVLLSFGLTARLARWQSRSWRIAALAMACSALMSMNNVVVRPQIWSLLPFVLFFYLLSGYGAGELDWQWLLLLPPLMVFWVNAHGAFVLGIVLLGVFSLGEIVRVVLGLRGALPWSGILKLAILGALTALATLINPRGFGIWRYVVGLMTDPPSQSLIVEWQSPTPAGVANIAFFVTVLLLLVSIAYSRYRPTPTEALLLVGFLWLAWNGQRYVIWFGLVSMPILAQAIAGLGVKLPFVAGPRRWRNTALALVLFVPVLVVQPWWVEAVPLPGTYWAQVHKGLDIGALIDTCTPVDAVAYLRAHPGGQLFHEMGYGSYLIWALPEQGVFVDPRVELYPYDQWLDYVRITQGIRYNELLEAYGADRLLLDRVAQEELLLQLSQDPAWEREYQDAYSEVWRRSS